MCPTATRRDIESWIWQMCPELHPEEVEDVASDAMVVWCERGTHGFRAVIEALRARFGRHEGTRERRRAVVHPLALEADYAVPGPTRGVQVADGLDLARWLARGHPAWVLTLLEGVLLGLSVAEAAQAAGVTYDGWHWRLRNTGLRARAAKEAARSSG